MEGERRQEKLNEYRRVQQPGCLEYEPEVYPVDDREAGKCMFRGRLWCGVWSGWAGLKQRDDTRWGPVTMAVEMERRGHRIQKSDAIETLLWESKSSPYLLQVINLSFFEEKK